MDQPKQEQRINRRTVNLDSTVNCRPASACATCSCVDQDALDVATIDTEIGVACLTLCDACAEARRLPRLYFSQAAEMVFEHCEHLGIDLDGMAVLRRDGRD
jgi:hypothetical protein